MYGAERPVLAPMNNFKKQGLNETHQSQFPKANNIEYYDNYSPTKKTFKNK